MYVSRSVSRLRVRVPSSVAAQVGVRTYASPVNTRNSVDSVLGIAPPAAPQPIPEGTEMPSPFPTREASSSASSRRHAHASSSRTVDESSLPEWLRNAGRPNNPNDISDLLKGKRPPNTPKTPSSKAASKAPDSLGNLRRGTQVPTQNTENPLAPGKHTVEVVIEGQGEEGPTPVDREHPHAVDALYGRNDLDERILAAARALHHSRHQQASPGKDASTLGALLKQFDAHTERTLSIELVNESVPKDDRRVPITSALSGEQELRQCQEDGVLLIAYVTGLEKGRGQERITLCSGFAVEGGERLAAQESNGKGALVVSCAHTLRGALPKGNQQDTSIALAVTRSGHVLPIKTLLSSLPMSDLILVQLGEEAIVVDENTVIGTPLRTSPIQLRTLPISPYPAVVGTELCVSSFWGWEDDAGSTLPAFEFVENRSTASTSSSSEAQLSSSSPQSLGLMISPRAMPPPVGREHEQVKRERDDAGRSRWGRARLVEYRDMTGQEASTGTYDELAQLDFKLLPDNMHNPPALQAQSSQRGGTAQFPPAGSSGGPIIDAATGAVVGITRGNKMSQLQGKRGYGVPAERLFFMFALPGFGKKA